MKRKRTECMGPGDPLHSKAFKIGEYRNEKSLIKGRSITFRNVEVRRCGCQLYNYIGSMLGLLVENPRKTIVTWHSKAKKWS